MPHALFIEIQGGYRGYISKLEYMEIIKMKLPELIPKLLNLVIYWSFM